MWKGNAKPTPANVRKRLYAAIEALEAAEELAAKNPRLSKIPSRARNAAAWARDALNHATLK